MSTDISSYDDDYELDIGFLEVGNLDDSEFMDWLPRQDKRTVRQQIEVRKEQLELQKLLDDDYFNM